jgi:hypothetical protein
MKRALILLQKNKNMHLLRDCLFYNGALFNPIYSQHTIEKAGIFFCAWVYEQHIIPMKRHYKFQDEFLGPIFLMRAKWTFIKSGATILATYPIGEPFSTQQVL